MSGASKADLDAQLGLTAALAGSSQTEVAQSAIGRQREWTAKWIIRVLIGSVAAVLLLCLVEALRSDTYVAITHASDLVKSVVLPVVTLVLGYYFGQESKP